MSTREDPTQNNFGYFAGESQYNLNHHAFNHINQYHSSGDSQQFNQTPPESNEGYFDYGRSNFREPHQHTREKVVEKRERDHQDHDLGEKRLRSEQAVQHQSDYQRSYPRTRSRNACVESSTPKKNKTRGILRRRVPRAGTQKQRRTF
eukprot:TRINITY_DN9432_c0_g1_i1.p1 TRINITY_DN9432_c0_g1~~TRINITY_DN9432_c0_g1_i1.p1  ORF type:complete len:148 (-),score=20.12 TRINITY_DN9432_c0_g1_i1:450-893(-)